jgi:hypothetical protein
MRIKEWSRRRLMLAPELLAEARRDFAVAGGEAARRRLDEVVEAFACGYNEALAGGFDGATDLPAHLRGFAHEHGPLGAPGAGRVLRGDRASAGRSAGQRGVGRGRAPHRGVTGHLRGVVRRRAGRRPGIRFPRAGSRAGPASGGHLAAEPITMPIAIVGVGCRYPDADGLDRLWETVVAGCSCDYFAELTGNRITMDFGYFRTTENGPARLVARGRQEVACMTRGSDGLAPADVPEELRAALQAYAC